MITVATYPRAAFEKRKEMIIRSSIKAVRNLGICF